MWRAVHGALWAEFIAVFLFAFQHCWRSKAVMEDVRWGHRLQGQCVLLHLTRSFLQGFNAASQDLATRDSVCTEETLTHRSMTDLPHVSLILTDAVSSATVGHYSQIMKQAVVQLLPQTDCASQSYYGHLITENMLCAGSPDWSTDACKVSKVYEWTSLCLLWMSVQGSKVFDSILAPGLGLFMFWICPI